jgi:ligand-binding sensor domain-containing protein
MKRNFRSSQFLQNDFPAFLLSIIQRSSMLKKSAFFFCNLITIRFTTARIFFGIALLFFAVSSVSSQYRFDQWTTDDGLPQNSVFSILQTNDGYVWITTLDGLVRFDGVKFKVFNRSNSPGLVTNRLINLFAKNDNNGIWVGTEDGGLLRFQNGEFRVFTTEDGLASNKIYKIFKDFDDQLLVAAQ